MVSKPRKKLTTREAQQMGVQAAREWELERQREQVELNPAAITHVCRASDLE